MVIILIINWHIYSWHHLVHTFMWLGIVSCQSLNYLTLFPNPSSTRCNTNLGCKTAFAIVRCMFWILHAKILMCEVACSQSVTLPFLHSFVISYIIMTNYAKALSIGVDEFIVSLDPTNGIHREITLLHFHEPIKFHDPIITFKMFIFIIIIGLHIIWNMSWVHKHVTQPSTMWSIPCSTVMNDILLKNVCACENDHNLVFTHVPSQCPFTCATKYFNEWEFHHVNNIWKALAPYTPSSITLKG